MKKHFLYLVLAVACFVFNSCKPGARNGKAWTTAEGITGIAADLNSAFGKDASFTHLSLNYIKDFGTIVTATGTKDPASKKLIEKQKTNAGWEDMSQVTLEIEGDAKPADFMFTLNDLDNLTKVPDMVKQSVDKIKKEKNFDVVAENVNIVGPSRANDPDYKVSIMVNLKPENGGTSFTVTFDKKGNFEKIIY
jgi:hypothetical protein